MHHSKVASFLMVPALALGCAATGDDVESAEGAASAGIEFTAAVGAVVIEGKKVCTAALVDVDADAKIGSASARGRQIVLGGACIGRLSNDFKGGALFVTQASGMSLATPILSIDFESQASAGIAVGILASQPADTKPIRLLGVDAAVNAGIRTATVLHANREGALVGAGVAAHAGVEFNVVTKCTEFHFEAQAGVAVGAGVGVDDDELDGAALVKVNGELRFAAHVDGKCLVKPFVKAGRAIKRETLEAANDLFDALNQVDKGNVIAVYRLDTDHTKLHTLNLHLYGPTPELLLTGQGSIQSHVTSLRLANGQPVAADAMRCTKDSLLGPCQLPGPFTAGSDITLEVDTGHDILPDHDGMKFVISTPKRR
jgi:hypothetical protein